MRLSLAQALVAVFASAAVIFGTRLLPFVIFNRKEPPVLIRFIEKYTPSMIMAILVVYCFKDIDFASVSNTVPFLAGVLATVILHLSVKNTLVSIFGSTILYIVLSRLM